VKWNIIPDQIECAKRTLSRLQTFNLWRLWNLSNSECWGARLVYFSVFDNRCHRFLVDLEIVAYPAIVATLPNQVRDFVGIPVTRILPFPHSCLFTTRFAAANPDGVRSAIRSGSNWLLQCLRRQPVIEAGSFSRYYGYLEVEKFNPIMSGKNSPR
jgi:hypothetical protein